VPGRNLVFFTYAAALAYRRGIATLVGGMCETDFSGYPDCRNETLQTLAHALSLGLDKPLSIATPLMFIDKAATWQLAHDLGGKKLVDLILEQTHTCYLGDRTHRHAWGYGCGTCPACELRRKGWTEWTARN
jgi:7-cyano-7-deazaguanine synthase